MAGAAAAQAADGMVLGGKRVRSEGRKRQSCDSPSRRIEDLLAFLVSPMLSSRCSFRRSPVQPFSNTLLYLNTEAELDDDPGPKREAGNAEASHRHLREALFEWRLFDHGHVKAEYPDNTGRQCHGNSERNKGIRQKEERGYQHGDGNELGGEGKPEDRRDNKCKPRRTARRVRFDS